MRCYNLQHMYKYNIQTVGVVITLKIWTQSNKILVLAPKCFGLTYTYYQKMIIKVYNKY